MVVFENQESYKIQVVYCMFERVIVRRQVVFVSACMRLKERSGDTDVLLANRCEMILHKYYNLSQYLPG